MTTDEKIAKIKWYIDVVKPHSEGSIKTYFLGLAQGINNAWFLDGSVSLTQYEEMNKLIDEVGK